jgi:hypothetical protein
VSARKKRVKARAGKRKSPSRPPDPNTVRVPDAIDFALDQQRDSLETAISILYCLHATLCYQDAGVGGRVEDGAVEEAAKGADLADITAMLLVLLNGIHIALDSTELEKAHIDPERLEMAEAVRKLGIGNDEREAS